MALKKKRKPTSIPDLDNKRPLKRKGFYTLLLTALFGIFLFVTYYAVQQVQVYRSSAAASCSGLSKNKCGSTKGCYFDQKQRKCVKSGSSSTDSGPGCVKSGGVCNVKENLKCCSGSCKNVGPGGFGKCPSGTNPPIASNNCMKINLQKVCEKTSGCKWGSNKCVVDSSPGGGGGDSGGGGGTAGCKKDRDCTGNKVCKNGKCTADTGGGTTASCTKINLQKVCEKTSGCKWSNNKCVKGSGGGGGDGSNPCKDAGGSCRLKSNGCGVDETQSGKSCAGLDPANKVCCLSTTAGSNPCKDAGNACRTKANGCGEGELETDLACAGLNPDNKICCEVVDEPPPGETGTATFDMSLSFQGIIGLPLSGETTMDVLITLAGGELVEPVSQTTTFAVDNNGVWTGEVSFDNITSGAGYKLLVKGPKHMQKKVCEVTPTETTPGTYRCGDGDITVSVDTINAVDFSGIRLLVGDLPSQDGIVDAYDVSLIRNGFCTTENPDICKDSKLLSEADLNLDGIIDSQDHSLVISSLSIKYDEL